MSESLIQARLAIENLLGSEGRFDSAFNAAMNAKTFDGTVYTNMLAAMRQQAQGLMHLARLVTDLQQQVEKLSKK